MFTLQLVPKHRITGGDQRASHEQLLAVHNKILSNFFDTYAERNLSPRTLKADRTFIEGWFRNYRVVDDSDGERQIFIWEAMAPVVGQQRVRGYLQGLSQYDEDDKVLLKPDTARAYAGKLDRLFIHTLENPYIEGTETIQSRFGLIENPFTGVQYPTHTRDHLRDEKYFLTPEQILDLLVLLREKYSRVSKRRMTAGRLYAVIVLITEAGMRCVEVINLDALGDDRDIFYQKGIIQTRFGKACNGSGPLTRLMPLTDFCSVSLAEYESDVRVLFSNHTVEPALFLTLRGKRLSYNTLSQSFSRFIAYARQEGLDLPPDLSLHDLRASFATNFLEEHPEQFIELMEILGHVSPSSTRLYIRSRRQKTRVATMNEARRLAAARTGLSRPVFNNTE